MKKLLILVITSAIFLTACGQLNGNGELSELGSEVQISQVADRHITEIEMHESGGIDGRMNYWHFFIDDNGDKMLVFKDRRDETKTYMLSDEDYAEISSIKYYRYRNKKDNNKGICDAVYYDVIIRYDDNTEEKTEVNIPNLWEIFNHYLYECEPIEDSCTTQKKSTEIIDRHITEIEMYETGGEDGRSNYWHFFIDENDEKNLIFKDRFDETKTYILSDDDYAQILNIDFSKYIGEKDDNEGVCDAIYYDVTIRYDDNTEEKSEASIPDLWKEFNYFLYECESVNDSAENNTDNLSVKDLETAYFKEPKEDDIIFDEETGIKYVRNQLLISVEFNIEKQLVEDIVKEVDAEIVGMIELTGDYQIEFTNDKTTDELEKIADYIKSYQFVSNVTLNMIIETSYDSVEIE